MTGRHFKRGIGQGTAAFIAAVLLSAASWAASPAAGPAEHVILIEHLSFILPEDEIRPGDTITWINKDIVPHTATARDRTWDSGNLEPGQSWKMIAGEPGTLVFYCAYHPQMTGLVQVRK